LKTAIFSDVHGNLEALEAVLEHASRESVGRWVCLGDVVGYGADPDECVSKVRGLPNVVCLKGNHDAAAANESERAFFHEVALEGIAYTVSKLTPGNLEFLDQLPYVYDEAPGFMAVHASPFHPESWEYVLDQFSAERAFNSMDSHRVAFIGHSHAPVVFSDDGRAERFAPGDPVMLDVDRHRYVINVGSVGQPRDGNPDASYVVFDDETTSVRLLRVHYDRERAAEKILKAGLPPVLAERLLVGY
jgi:diadenosine tetraphosphatase ApaH/serine/threonine PP2A family protein phosphatase